MRWPRHGSERPALVHAVLPTRPFRSDKRLETFSTPTDFICRVKLRARVVSTNWRSTEARGVWLRALADLYRP